jgi:hypothetical protein
MFDVIKSVNNGDLHTTEGIYPVPEPEIVDRQFSSYRIKQFEYYCSILGLIGDGLITGNKFDSDGHTHYQNLRLTKSGNETLRFGQLTLKDIDNSYGKDSIKDWLLKPVIVAAMSCLITALISGAIGFYMVNVLAEEAPLDQSNTQPQSPEGSEED